MDYEMGRVEAVQCLPQPLEVLVLPLELTLDKVAAYSIPDLVDSPEAEKPSRNLDFGPLDDKPKCGHVSAHIRTKLYALYLALELSILGVVLVVDDGFQFLLLLEECLRQILEGMPRLLLLLLLGRFDVLYHFEPLADELFELTDLFLQLSERPQVYVLACISLWDTILLD